ncbi:MAG: G4 quadruplex nucleic acid binding protein [Chrysothrix sp. TS-e1954]|nr:MAG: G4 quadruplex nucleic acid binding protein [Chrysothrix sp. TS-e1954]
MTTSIAPTSPLAQLLRQSYPTQMPNQEVTEIPANELIKPIFPDIEYSDPEKAEINQWLITSTHLASADEDQAKTTERLSALNTHLSTRTTVLGSKPSLADIALYSRLGPVVAKWSAEERTGEQGYHHIVRHLDFVQNSSIFDLKLPQDEKIPINPDEIISPVKPIDPKAEKERKKREREVAIAAGDVSGASTSTLPVIGGGRKAKKEAQKEASKPTGDIIAAAVGASTPGVAQPSAGSPREASANNQKPKKEKQPKPQKAAPAPEKPLSPSLIDLRVGHILKAERHPDADSLYVSTVACGDAAGTPKTSEYEGTVVRTVCSGLNGLVPLEEMQGRKIVAVCNLKPVKMRGIESAAMVLAASPRLSEGEVEDPHAGPVELVSPSSGAEAGDRVNFEGWEEGEPDPVLNPKKKVWEMCQVGFITTEGCEVGFDAGAVPQLEGKSGVGRLKTKDGLCTVKSLKGATVR